MSEINSIANGTFTIGQTNNLTFSAGPGIKIDSPSEGVVRIGNDETVLWSADLSIAVSDRASGTNFNLSETTMNFERLGIYFAKKWPINGMNDLGYGYMEVPTNFLTTQNGNMLIDACVRDGAGSLMHNVALLSGCNTNKITECGGLQAYQGSYGTNIGSSVFCHPYLFIGINRKEV